MLAISLISTVYRVFEQEIPQREQAATRADERPLLLDIVADIEKAERSPLFARGKVVGRWRWHRPRPRAAHARESGTTLTNGDLFCRPLDLAGYHHFSYTRQCVTGALGIARQLSRAWCFSTCRAASQVERCVDRRHVRFRIEPGARAPRVSGTARSPVLTGRDATVALGQFSWDTKPRS